LEFNNGKLPFAAAQIGKAFRNEISPRSGLLRVREFEMAEIEHFVHPEKRNKFEKFSNVADLSISLFSACNQMDGKSAESLTLGDAVRSGLVANETLGYFIGRIYLFLTRIGVDPAKLRFRQHMSNEMAHYASDCWDAECLTSYGWVECVGCADRSCYDLTCHVTAAKVDMSAKEQLSEPLTVDVVEVAPEKGIVGKQFRKEAKVIMDGLSALSSSQAEAAEREATEKGSYELEVGDQKYTLQHNMFKIKRYQKTVHVVDVIPSVIEPSFGVGRILYTVLEHSFGVREGDEQRAWLALPPCVAPVSCSVLPLSSNEQFSPFVQQIASGLKSLGISHKIDDSGGSIGRRYARTDEIGIPFGVTVDFDTLQSSTATLRERDSMRQIRASLEELPGMVSSLVSGQLLWAEVERKWPTFTGQESTQ
jgi:glycyl-tRNA synthetase